MTNTPVLEQYIENSGYKRNFIAKQLGITSYTLAMKIQNVSEFKASEIDILCSLLGIDIKERMQIFFAKSVELNSTTI